MEHDAPDRCAVALRRKAETGVSNQIWLFSAALCEFSTISAISIL